MGVSPVFGSMDRTKVAGASCSRFGGRVGSWKLPLLSNPADTAGATLAPARKKTAMRRAMAWGAGHDIDDLDEHAVVAVGAVAVGGRTRFAPVDRGGEDQRVSARRRRARPGAGAGRHRARPARRRGLPA